jgi:hypothetical protein
VDYFRKFWRKVDLSIKLRRRNELIYLERQKRRLQRAQKSRERAADDRNAENPSQEAVIRRSG